MCVAISILCIISIRSFHYTRLLPRHPTPSAAVAHSLSATIRMLLLNAYSMKMYLAFKCVIVIILLFIVIVVGLLHFSVIFQFIRSKSTILPVSPFIITIYFRFYGEVILRHQCTTCSIHCCCGCAAYMDMVAAKCFLWLQINTDEGKYARKRDENDNREEDKKQSKRTELNCKCLRAKSAHSQCVAIRESRSTISSWQRTREMEIKWNKSLQYECHEKKKMVIEVFCVKL